MAEIADNQVEINAAQQEELRAHFARAVKKVNIVFVICGIFSLASAYFALTTTKDYFSGYLPIGILISLYFLVRQAFNVREKEIASGHVRKEFLKFLKK